jgi:hypothetical protein
MTDPKPTSAPVYVAWSPVHEEAVAGIINELALDQEAKLALAKRLVPLMMLAKRSGHKRTCQVYIPTPSNFQSPKPCDCGLQAALDAVLEGEGL